MKLLPDAEAWRETLCAIYDLFRERGVEVALEALAMMTRDAARVMRWPDIGSLQPGQCADVAVVDRDPLTCEVETLCNTTVLRTLLGGVTVHDSGELGAGR